MTTPFDKEDLRPAPWWCSPAGLALGFLLPIYGLVASAVELDISGLTVRGVNFLSGPYLALGAALIVTMALGGWIGQSLSPSPYQRVVDSRDCDLAALLIGAITFAAYLIWFKNYFLSPSELVAILIGRVQPGRQGIELVTGVTSLVNFGPVFFAMFAWRVVQRPKDPLAWWMKPLCGLLGALCLFRVYAWGERLALIEAVLPIALILVLAVGRSSRRSIRVLAVLGPFLALPLLLLYFGLAESVRSWTSPTYAGKLDFWDFALGRLASYYYTSLNNGAGLLSTNEWPTFHFNYVLAMLHTAPLSIGQMFSEFVGSSSAPTDAFLRRYGDPEFNNPSGLFTVVLDLGLPLGIAYFALVGFAAGMLFRRFEAGSFASTLLYPIFFIASLEVFRYPYLGSGRGLTWAIGVLVAWVIASGALAGRYRHNYLAKSAAVE